MIGYLINHECTYGHYDNHTAKEHSSGQLNFYLPTIISTSTKYTIRTCTSRNFGQPVIYSPHGKNVDQTWILNSELVQTGLNYKYRSLKSVRVLNFSGTAVTFLKRRLHDCIFAYHFCTCFHKSNECEAANLKFNNL